MEGKDRVKTHYLILVLPENTKKPKAYLNDCLNYVIDIIEGQLQKCDINPDEYEIIVEETNERDSHFFGFSLLPQHHVKLADYVKENSAGLKPMDKKPKYTGGGRLKRKPKPYFSDN